MSVAIEKSCTNDPILVIDEKKQVLKAKNPELCKIDPRKPKVLVIIPFAMVCTGKSHIWGDMQSLLK